MTQKLSSLSVVLCQPLYPRNIGMCARAMANTGFQQLILIDPQNIQSALDLEVREGAARAQGPLESSKTFKCWGDYLKTPSASGIRIGFSRRGGSLRAVEEWRTFLKQNLSELSERPVSLVFGREDVGLSGSDLEHCHHVCELPTWGEHGSYNLSHAVLLALYIVRDAGLETNFQSFERAQESEIFPDAIIQEWIETIGFGLEGRKINAFSVLKKLLLKNLPTAKELRILEAVVFQTVRKLKAQNQTSNKD